MEIEADEETSAPETAGFTLDILGLGDEPEPNKFHVSDVNLVDVDKNKINDNEDQIPLTVISEEDLGDEATIVETEIFIDTFDGKAAAEEDDSTGEEATDKNFRDYVEQTYETLEEVSDEIEEIESSVSEDFQGQEKSRLLRGSTTAMLSTEALLMQAKSKLALRAASIFDQRLKTIADLKDLFRERKKLKLKNRFLNDKCCDHLKKITTVNHFESTDGALPIHGNQRYYNVLEEFMEEKIHYDKTKHSLEEQTQNLTDSYYICRTRFEQVFGEFVSRELEVGSECIDGKTGKALNEQRCHWLTKKQQRKFDQLAEVRVHYLKLHNYLDSIHKKFRDSNVMGEGHTLMEYEQLLIINNSSMDKLDEREEELRRLREKCTEDVSILTYVKETYEAFIHDRIDAAAELEEVTEQKNEARSLLADQRLKRDLLRKETSEINATTGLLTNPILLRKMEVDLQALTLLKEQNEYFRHFSYGKK